MERHERVKTNKEGDWNNHGIYILDIYLLELQKHFYVYENNGFLHLYFLFY